MPEGTVEAASVIRAERAPSLVARVARAARDAAVGVEGVADVTAGPLGRQVTPDRNGAVAGVVATAISDRAYELELHLVARPVPLYPLAGRVRDGVTAEVAEALPEIRIGPISVAFEDLAGHRFPEPAEDGSPPPPKRRGRKTGAAKR
ncbi:MAG: hypothetical protein H0U12_07755 [Thermoleophilaceae bacterium]|nr:hypothetical protein [Thermoleophilaceae bacterium]